MSRLSEIKRRIKSVDSIGQVTHAMELVAASRMRKAQENAKRSRVYTEKIKQILVRVTTKQRIALHPLLDLGSNPSKTTLIVVFSPHRGLAGSLPWNLLRFVLDLIGKIQKDGRMIKIMTIGKKVRDQLSRMHLTIDADFSDISEHPTTSDIHPIVTYITSQYLASDIGRVLVIYPQFVNAVKQQPVARVLLPLDPAELSLFGDSLASISLDNLPFLFEPDQRRIVDELLPAYLEGQLFQARLETVASEYSARMVAMKSASDNAHELKDSLVLDFNKSRQSQITSELAEITGGGL
ncbi:ATP synthase F1 subunit gamma [Candidatus Wirthbacteria bacterium CG2_30_54_11]|uniref:ATP synthase gamma chain n=1 Tax=Candidatus Wirthbacteria bacterium CG2_30_54_11 TaxID=1817892 RepID=A0A1J5IFH8_9BACT|nr:MAG: ATP synthase F1 subunit gamma [Candidatus Wirthbacteria bacterium CG2_30_54_11]